MITSSLIGAIQDNLNRSYDGAYAIEITSIAKQPTFDKGGPQIQGDFVVQFTCHARRLGQKNYRRLAYVNCNGASIEIPNTIIVGEYL